MKQMKRNAVLVITLVIIIVGAVVHPAFANDDINSVLAQVRNATAAYHSIPAAQAAGYDLVPGLDNCFDNPGVGGMGFHYINTSLLDTVVDPLKPEAFVYAPDSSAKIYFVAIEYIVPIDAWDAVNTQPPSLFGQIYERNTTLGVYSLHAWIWKPNSSGMFNDWNPKISCSN